MKRAPAAFLSVILLLLPLACASAVTLYARRIVSVERGPLTVGTLVQASSGELADGLREALDRVVCDVAEEILYIPSEAYRSFFKDGSGDVILVGKRTLVVPKGSAGDQAASLLDKLVDQMEAKGLFGAGKTGIRIVQMTGLSQDSAVEKPSFKAIRVDTKTGLASGNAEFSYSGEDAGARTAAGRILLKIRLDVEEQVNAASGFSGVKANEAVSVLFRKGSIVIEMNGKTVSAAREGERVTVFVPESKKNFSGVVLPDKAVSVEIE